MTYDELHAIVETALWHNRGDREKAATAALAAAHDALREPSDDMLMAGSGGVHGWHKVHAIFRRALDASPLAPPTQRDGTTLMDYWLATSDGPLYEQWADKPHRLLYDLIGEVLHLRAANAQLERERDEARREVAQLEEFIGRWGDDIMSIARERDAAVAARDRLREAYSELDKWSKSEITRLRRLWTYMQESAADAEADEPMTAAEWLAEFEQVETARAALTPEAPRDE